MKAFIAALLLAPLAGFTQVSNMPPHVQQRLAEVGVYQFNSADDALGREVTEFIRRGR